MWRHHRTDFLVRNGEIVTDFRKRAKDDKSIWGLKGEAKKDLLPPKPRATASFATPTAFS